MVKWGYFLFEQIVVSCSSFSQDSRVSCNFECFYLLFLSFLTPRSFLLHFISLTPSLPPSLPCISHPLSLPPSSFASYPYTLWCYLRDDVSRSQAMQSRTCCGVTECSALFKTMWQAATSEFNGKNGFGIWHPATAWWLDPPLAPCFSWIT